MPGRPPDLPPDVPADGPPDLPSEPRSPSDPIESHEAHRAHRPWVVVLAIVLVAALAGGAVLVAGQRGGDRSGERARAQASRSAKDAEQHRRDLQGNSQDAIERIAEAVSRLRGLAFKKAVAPEVVSDAELRARVVSEFEKGNSRTEIEETDKVLTALGMLRPSDDMRSILLGVQTEQIAGFYDSKTKRLVVVGSASNPSPLDRAFIAHELTHALTDQYFDLSRVERLADEGKDDEATALAALVEGDATVTMTEYVREVLTPEEQGRFVAQSAALPSEKLEGAPAIVRESLLFPYNAGTQFVEALTDHGGQSLLDEAYRDPPSSTEQVLHPEKYLATHRDNPKVVELPGLAGAMGTGWKSLDEGVIGEIDVRLIVSQFMTPSEGVDAGTGWGGGRYVAVENSQRVVVAVLTVWDSESRARVAEETLDRWLPLRYGGQGSAFTPQGSIGRGWKSSVGSGEVVRAGSTVLLVVGTETSLVERARSAFPGLIGSV